MAGNTYCMRCMTSFNGAAAYCPSCGFPQAQAVNQAHQLPCGSILAGTYLIGMALGQGGFGITYVGYDLNLAAKVAIKEYYPQGLVTREQTSGSTVLPMSGEKGSTFQSGKERFIREARTLARFASDPAIVNVWACINENGTAYIVMDFVEGTNLRDYAQSRGGRLPAGETLALLWPVMEALDRVHGMGLLHRDISPDNLMLRPDGTVKLIDFGAARTMSLSGEHSNTINVKHGYAPEEQYRTRGEQGPYTDVYALCATIYRLTTGVTPVPSMDRMAADRDPLLPPNALGAGLSPSQQDALLRGLAIRARDRIPDMKTLENALFDRASQQEAVTYIEKTDKQGNGSGRGLAARLLAGLAACASLAVLFILIKDRGDQGSQGATPSLAAGAPDTLPPSATSAPTPSPRPTSSPTPTPSPRPTDSPQPPPTGDPVSRSYEDEAFLRASDLYDRKQYQEAVELMLPLAKQGSAAAQFYMGLCNENGYGVSLDEGRAFYWYGLSARQGDGNGQSYLGNCYRNGRGTDKDIYSAVDWYRLSAQQGNKYGLLNLGYCYHHGMGVSVDRAEARRLYQLADAAGHPYARVRLQELDEGK